MMKGILIVLLVLLLGNVILLYLLAPRLSGRRRVHPFFGVKWAHRGLHDIKKGISEEYAEKKEKWKRRIMPV